MKSNLTAVSELRVKLYVSDFAGRRAFYAEVVGWPVIEEWNHGPNQRGVMFDTGSGVLELLYERGAGPHATNCDVSLRVPDVWQLWQELRNDAQVVFPLRDNAWGDSSFCIADPGGFRLTFFTVTGDAN